MKIMFLNGGLANQMFQYTFYRFGQIMNQHDDWYLDDSFFFVNDIHNGYELNKVFGLRPNLLSEYFDEEVWAYMIEEKKKGKSIPELLLENDIDIRMISEYGNWKEWNPFSGKVEELGREFEESKVREDGNIYYNGYGLKSVFFKKIENTILQELKFPEITDEKNRQYLHEIEETNSCSLHVRRGDFVALGGAAPDELYRSMIEEILKKEPDTTLFLFSDDLPYCDAHRKEMGLDLPEKVVFIEGNSRETAFRDMQLMSNCRNMIVGNSSFPFMASLLNRRVKTILTFRNDRYI